MIDMMDSMVKKITGSPVLFNAFRKTLGGETVEESFETPNTESMDEFGLVEAAQELMEENKPTNPELWSQAKSKARAKFDVYPSAYANGWAVKWYNEQGGDWKSVSEGKTFFDLQSELNEYMTTMNRKSPKENATAREKARKLRDEMESQKMPKPKPVKEASEVTEIYRITPARRAVLDKIKGKATSDANRESSRANGAMRSSGPSASPVRRRVLGWAPMATTRSTPGSASAAATTRRPIGRSAPVTTTISPTPQSWRVLRHPHRASTRSVMSLGGA
jgi:hypothetical protein